MDNFRLYALCLTAKEIADIFEDTRVSIGNVRSEGETFRKGKPDAGGWFDLGGRSIVGPSARPGVYVAGRKKVVVQ